MDFLELAKSRYSLRQLAPDKVEPEKLALILEAGRVAPTAVNFQPQRILVLDQEEDLSRLAECTKYHFDAPLALIISYDRTVSWTRRDGVNYGMADVSIAVTQMMLEAHSLGLGTTYVGAFDAEKLREVYEIPENLIPVAILPIGYPGENAHPSRKHEDRIPLAEMVSYHRYER